MQKYLYLFKEDLKFIAFELENFLDKFEDSVFFVTGGTGIIGKWILETLCFLEERYRLNLKVYVLTRNKEKFFSQYPLFRDCRILEFVQGNVISFSSLNVVRDEVDYVVHGATESSSSAILKSPLKMFEVIVKGTWNVLECSKNWSPKGILILSSGAVYGKQGKKFLEETDFGCINFTEPLLAYTMGKEAGEHLAMLYFYTFRLPVKIARIFALVGPHLPLEGSFAIGNFIRDALKGGPIVIKGDGTPVRSYLYLGDLVIWLFKILLEGKAGEAYNAGSDKAISIKELAQLVADFTKKELKEYKKIEILIQQNKIFSSASDVYVPSIEKAKKELGLKVFTPLEEAIQKTFYFYRLKREGSKDEV
ncbi:MAG: NAD(P)-dependent oxidoreductase [Thermodesulfobacterium sp.]|nr:NAD(P)-dependent oxidoreductase [Thermodesulfobacterium sp.]